MSFSTMEQLRSRTWPTKEAALKDLRSNGFKVRGADYEVRETSTGVWQIMDVEAANNDNDTADKPAPRKTGRKATAASAKAEPQPEPPPTEPPPSPNVAEEVAEELAARTAPDEGLFPDTFELVLGERLTRDAATTAATEIARNAAVVVHIRAETGEVVSVTEPPPPTPGRGTTTRQDVPLTELAKSCIALARRKEGAKRTELSALNNGIVINWKGYLDRVGRREGLTLTVDRTGPIPVYFLK